MRLRAAEPIDTGHRDAEIAERLRVTPESVCRWRAAYRRAGAAGLATKGHGGRQPLVKRDIAALASLVKTRLRRMQNRPRTLAALLAKTGLNLQPP